MGKFRNSIMKFMYGRYGIDGLYYFGIIVFFAIMLINVFVENTIASIVLYLLSLSVFGLMFWRTMSKNKIKRYAEYQKFLAVKKKITAPFKLMKNKIKDRKTHRYYKCTKCKAVIRVKYIKGEHAVSCPVCHTQRKINIK